MPYESISKTHIGGVSLGNPKSNIELLKFVILHEVFRKSFMWNISLTL